MPNTCALFASGIMHTDIASLFKPCWVHSDIKIETRLPNPDSTEVPAFWGIAPPAQMQRSCFIVAQAALTSVEEHNFYNTFQIHDATTIRKNLPEIISIKTVVANSTEVFLQQYFDDKAGDSHQHHTCPPENWIRINGITFIAGLRSSLSSLIFFSNRSFGDPAESVRY